MKRNWLVLTTLVIAIVLISGLMLILARSPGRNPETWEDVTESYIRHRGANLGRLIKIERAVKAKTPDNFTQDMNFHTYSDTASYYAVDETSGNYPNTPTVPYAFADLTAEPTLPAQTNNPYTATGGGFRTSRPIPYPPAEVWCVLLKLTSEDTYFVVFANLHMDMYNAQWIIHEGEKSPFSQTFVERVASFGCDLDLAYLSVK